MEVIKISKLSKDYGNKTGIFDVSFSVKKGEVFGFIGPNGAGKSTTIRILLGILKPTDGKATIFEKDVWNDAVDIHKKVAYVPGDVSLWPNLTGGEIIDLFIKLQGTNNNDRREELIKKFDLDPSKKARTYSKGNKQKVALIAALSSDADLYILDEPTSGLDPLMEQVFQECILELKEQGKTIFLSSHILSEVEKLCDRVAIIKEGRIADIGTLDEMRYLTKTTIYAKTREAVKGISKLPYISNFKGTETEFEFNIESQKLGDIITLISKSEIIMFENRLPSLEELFMKHYNTKQDGE